VRIWIGVSLGAILSSNFARKKSWEAIGNRNELHHSNAKKVPDFPSLCIIPPSEKPKLIFGIGTKFGSRVLQNNEQEEKKME